VAAVVRANTDGTFPPPYDVSAAVSAVAPAVAPAAVPDAAPAAAPAVAPVPSLGAVPPARQSPPSSGYRFYDRATDSPTCWGKLCPVTDATAVLSWYNDPQWHASSKPLVKGDQECMLARAAPPMTLAVPISGDEFWVTLLSHASYGKAGVTYEVQIQLEVTRSLLRPDDVADQALTLQRVRRVVHAHCSCTAGLSGHCWHVAYALHVMQNQLRPDSREAQSPTAVLQRWNQPSASSTASATDIRLLHGATRADVAVIQTGGCSTSVPCSCRRKSSPPWSVGDSPP
jgi:hypothetical protein